jgi:RNase P/RNase MRP subunit POP5
LGFVGILGYAKASPQIIKAEKGRVVLAINRSELDKIRASLMLSGTDMRVERVSGIIKKL